MVTDRRFLQRRLLQFPLHSLSVLWPQMLHRESYISIISILYV